MTSPAGLVGGRDFAVSGSLSPEEIYGLLPPGLRAERDRRTRLRRAWLDTADGRLAKRGFTLVHLTDGERRLLVLESRSEAVTAVASADLPRWPADLPAAVASRMASWLGLRALLPQQTVDTTAAVLRVLDDEAKTVGRLWLERTQRGGKQTLRVNALRGYDREATRVAKALSRDPRLSRIGPSAPQMPEPPKPPALVRGMPAAHAVAAVLAHLFDVVEANVDGTIAALDTEFLHDLRVAVRRSRSAFKLTAEVLPTQFSARFVDRFRWLGDLTTPARDLDVLLLDLPALRAALPGHTGDDLEALHALLVERVELAYADLAKGLRSARFRQLASSYRIGLSRVATSTPKALLVGAAADGWANAAMEKVLRRGGRIASDSPPELLHDLRKRCKELRYCLELFEPLWDDRDLGRVVTELKALQDNLGAFQDSEVQSATLRRWAEELATQGAPASTVMAIGRLTVHLEASQNAARAEFSERFTRFARPANRRRFAAMTGASS